MADFSRPLHRNHSAILSKKLSNVHSFAEKSIYDDVFATPSKRRARTFSSRVEDYSEIFNSSHSSRPSSIPILDLPVVDKQNVCVNIQNSKFEYSEIFGGFNNIDISIPEEFIKSKDGDTSLGEVWSSSETGSPSGASDISNSRKKNHVRPHDANHQSIDGKKQFNMSYNKTNVGSQDWTNGTTHIAQLHAVPGFTCIIDENTPLPKTEGNKSVPSVNDVSPNRGVGKGILTGKHFRKASAHLPDRGVNGHTFEAVDVKFGHSRSYSSDLVFNAYEIGQNVRHTEVMRPSGPEPNLGNINSHSERVSASKSGEFKHEDLESTRSDFSITFSDEELDTNSDAAVSAAAVRKAIEMAQASIRIAKESMERKKGFQSSLKQSFKDGLKFKERKNNKIADEGNRLKEKKTQEPCETEKTSMQNISETDMKNARTGEASPTFEDSKDYFPDEGAAGGTNGKGSESVPVVEHKQERQRESETTQQSYDFLNIGKYREMVSKEDNKKEMMQFIDEYDWKRWKTTDTIELPDSDGKNLKVVEEAFELEQIGRKLDADKEGAQEGENHGNKLESAQDVHENEEIEKNLRVAPKQEETEEKLKASQEQKQSEKTLIESQKTVENEKEFETQEWEMDDFKKGLKEFQFETEINLKQAHEGEENEKISEADGGFEEIEKNLRVAPKQEETEEKLKASEEQKQSEKTLIESQKTVENEKEFETQEWEMDDFKKGLKEFQFETEINLKQAHEGEENEKISEADGGFEENVEIYEEKYERWLKICEEDKTNFKEAEIGLEKVQEQELRVDDYHGGKASDKKLEDDIEGEGIGKLDEAENDKLLKEEKNGFLTCEEKNHQGSYDACKQDEREKLRSVEETSSKEIDDDVEATREELACEGSSRVIEATEAYSEPEENESACESVYNDKLNQDNESAYNEVFRQTSWDQDALDADDDELENSMDDESDALLNDDDDDAVHEAEKNENDLNTVSAAYIMEEKEMFLAKDALEEQNDIENITDDKETLLVDDLGLSLGEEENLVDQNENKSGFAHSLDEQVEKRTHELEITSDAMKEAEVVFDQVEEISQFQVAHGDKQWLENEQEMEACELNSDREAEETVQENAALEKKHLRNLDEAKAKENERERERVRERERERQAVDRAIREARERAFAEAREKAERAALERATAEARQRVKTDFRERVDNASAGAKSRVERSSMEAKLRAERAAVERATEEARERALEKALSKKAAFKTREQTKSRSFSSADPPQGSGPSSSFRHSNSSNYGVTSATERSDDGANTESAQRCKARLEKDQRIVERAAKALEEKNKRDLLAQKEQAERNRFAEALDADVKRWSSGKAGNLRALLSTLQYVLGPGSGWQPIPLTDIVTNSAVKKAYRKATLFVHPDKLQQRGASIQQKYICEKVFDLLKEAWNRFNSEER